MRYLFTSKNLIGDSLYIGPALRAWLIKQEDKECNVYMQTLPDHVAPLYVGMIRDLFGQHLSSFRTMFERPDGEFDFEHIFDVNAAFALSDQRRQHIAESYAQLLGVGIGVGPDKDGYSNLKPIYIPEQYPVQEIERIYYPGNLEGCVLISMFSASCESRDKDRPGMPPNKMLPFDKWKSLMDLIRREYPNVPIRFLGAPSDIIPDGYAKGLVEPGEYMLGIPLNRLALIMQKAALVVTIDNGMSHLAASQETPTFLMYPQCLAPYYILPIGNPNLTWVQMNPVTVNARQLTHGLQFAINKFKAAKR